MTHDYQELLTKNTTRKNSWGLVNTLLLLVLKTLILKGFFRHNFKLFFKKNKKKRLNFYLFFKSKKESSHAR